MNEETLEPLTGPVKRSRFATVDLETKDGDTQKAGFTRPFLAGLYDGERYIETRGQDCIPYLLGVMLTEERDGVTYYAHNGGGFDWLHFLPHIRKLGFWFEIVTVASTIMMLRVKRSKDDHSKGWRFLDSFKLIPMGLLKATKSFGVEEKLSDHDLNLHEDDPSWSIYLERDCKSLFQVLTRFHDLIETRLNGEVGITAASTAMKTFRRGYMSGVIQRNRDSHAFIREAYFGGRVEVFQKQGSGLRYYDINSSYPASMLEPVPCGSALSWQGSPPVRLREGAYAGFARARVSYPADKLYPCLPWRDKESQRLLFPVGEFEGHWPAIELFAAEDDGATVEWLESVWIETRPALRPYVEGLYPYRDKSRPDYDSGLAETAKLLLNSLYGKFGQAVEREKIIILEPGQAPPEGARAASPGDPDCQVYYLTEEADAPYIVPAISAHITALSRLRLWRLLKEAERQGAQVCYCDTDSIITTADLSHLCSPVLGALKDEGDGKTWTGEFLQPKLYRLRSDCGTSEKVVMKGYRTRSWEIYDRVKSGEAITFQSLEKIGAMAKTGFLVSPKMASVTRSLKTEDQKRKFLDDGTSRPLVLTLPD